MEVFPERDGNWDVPKSGEKLANCSSEWRSSLKGMETNLLKKRSLTVTLVRMEVFPERDGNKLHDSCDPAVSDVLKVRMEVFPERDGNRLRMG